MISVSILERFGELALLFHLGFLLRGSDSHEVVSAASLVLVLVFKLIFLLFDFWFTRVLHSHQVDMLYIFHLLLLSDEKALIGVYFSC